MPGYDVIVLGLGAIGSAALHQLAKRGVRVLGIDCHSPPHAFGSSHGDTRITRLAIGEGIHYTPLAMRSHQIWREIERETGADLLTQCGELIISSENKSSFTHVPAFFENTFEAARRNRIVHELLDAVEIRRRYPAFNVRDDEFGYFEPEAGFVRPERCVEALLALARKHGARTHFDEQVLGFDADASGVTVATQSGSYRADRLIVAAGAWTPMLLGGDFEGLLRIYRQVLCWFEVDGNPAAYTPDRFPVFIWETQKTRQGIYGFPMIDPAGVKIATEQYDLTTTPALVDRRATPEELAATHRDFVAPYVHGVSARCAKSAVCLYTVTPDAGFIIDSLPGCERVIVASCCSGHGFKHAPALGEILSDLALGATSAFDLTPFCLARFG